MGIDRINAINALDAETGIGRYEENDPGLLYDGLIITGTAWSFSSYNPASGGITAYNGNTVGATVAYTFTGTWTAVGLMGNDQGGPGGSRDRRP